MAFNIKRSKVPHICSTSAPESQIAPCFAQFSFFLLATMTKFNLLLEILNFKIPIGNFCEDCHREHSENVLVEKEITTVGRVAF